MDFLKKLLTPETYAEIEEQLKDVPKMRIVNAGDGSYVPKDKMDSLRAQIKQQDETIEAHKEQLKKLGDGAGSEKMKKEIKDLQDKNAADLLKHQSDMKDRDVDDAITKALETAQVKSGKLVMPLIDREKLVVDGSEIIGLNEQLATIKTDHPYMFETKKADPGGSGNPGAKIDPSADDDLDVNLKKAQADFKERPSRENQVKLSTAMMLKRNEEKPKE